MFIRLFRISLSGFFLIICLCNSSGASSIEKDPTTDPAWKFLKASEFVKLDVKDFAKACGKKLKLTEKLAFGVLKAKVKRDLKKNPELLMTHYFEEDKKSKKTLWFFLAFLGPLALLVLLHLITGLNNSLFVFLPLCFAPIALVYLTKQGKEEKKAAWLGLGALAVLVTLIVLINNSIF